jgi:L-ascorbate metabolism protein UlaG (beta-lactamase superfamily)
VKQVFCPLGIADYLRYWNYTDEQIIEMDLQDKSSIFNLQSSITCLPSRHFSNRLLGKRNQTLWASFMVEADGRTVYIGGDGGYDKRFAEIHARFGAVDLALLENGQYNANWKYIHTMPVDLEKVIMDLQAKQVFTVHHDKFALSVHPWYEPDSVAHYIATKNNINLLDAPIGTVVRF